MEYKRSSSPVFSIGKNNTNSDDSASTVELSVSRTRPAWHMRFWSVGKASQDTNNNSQDESRTKEQSDTQQSTTKNDQLEPSTPKKWYTRQQQASANGKKRVAKKKSKVAFTLPHQRTIQRNGLDEQCHALNITYRRWPGTTEAKNYLHKSEVEFLNHNDYILANQPCLGDCILCPSQKYLQHMWDL